MNLDMILSVIGNPRDLPPAVGYLRDIQLGSLKILLEFDRICQQEQLSYFLFAGTLLGAVRHGGFVPWDEHIDVIMPRQDYERVMTIFNEHNQVPGLEAMLFSWHPSIWNLIKVQHTQCQSLFIDVLPYDFYYKQLTLQENAQLADHVKQLILCHGQTPRIWPNMDAFIHSFLELAAQQLPDLQYKAGVKPMLMYGPEYLHSNTKYWALDYDTVFPLRPIEFEGHTFFGPNDPDIVLTMYYGDYMRLSTSFYMPTVLDQIQMEEILAIKQFIRA